MTNKWGAGVNLHSDWLPGSDQMSGSDGTKMTRDDN